MRVFIVLCVIALCALEVKAAHIASVKVDCHAPGTKLSEDIYGHFIEHLGHCIFKGLWDEQLENRRFDLGEVAHPGTAQHWTGWGDASKVEWFLDAEEKFGGAAAQRVTLKQPTTARLVQGGLVAQAGRAYDVYVWLKATGTFTRFDIALVGTHWRTYARKSFKPKCDGRWHRYLARLKPIFTDGRALVCFELEGEGTAWFDSASVKFADNVDGLRRDVLEAVEALRPPLVRWPGGCYADTYHWRDGIGPRDKRPTYPHSHWPAPAYNDFGTDEFFAFCKRLGAKPYLNLNMGTGTLQEALDWLEYCLGPSDSPNGRLRAENGHPAPYDLVFVGLGNEQYGHWEAGNHAGRPADYGKLCAEWARAIRARYPQLKILINGNADAKGWDVPLVKAAGDTFDFLTLHTYIPEASPQPLSETDWIKCLLAAPVAEERKFVAIWRAVKEALGTPKPLAYDEWNLIINWPPGYGAPRSLVDALYTAGIFNACWRQADKVQLTCVAQLINILGVLEVHPLGLAKTTQYETFALYRANTGEVALPVEYSGPTYDFPGYGTVPETKGVPWLDVACSRTGKHYFLAVSNRDLEQAAELQVQLEGAGKRFHVVRHYLSGESPYSANPYLMPWEVFVKNDSLGEWHNGGKLEIPPHSVNVFEFKED